MSGELRFFPEGDRAILAVLGECISEEVNGRVRQLYRAVCEAKAPQVVEAVPSYTSVLVHYRPELASYAQMKDFLSSLYDPAAAGAAAQPRTFCVPVCYGLHFGPDLWEMEKALGLSRQEIIDIHSGRDYRVYMMGFLPGFVYLGGMDERIAYPRLRKPRLHIDAGAVGIAGSQTGIYPSVSPGGWRIIGRTPIRMFDPYADPPVPVEPGDLVRFVPISVDEYYEMHRQEMKKQTRPQDQQSAPDSALRLKVLSAGPLTTVQDGGRFGSQAGGMTESGAMDRSSLRLANRLLGNEETAAALELTLAGGSFGIEGEGSVALTGADLQARLNGQRLPMNEAVAVRSGDKLEFGPAIRGVRAYLAVSGGIDVPPVLGSRSTNLKAGIGGFEGRRLKAGDTVHAA
ncbi:MAG: 5-oxoprolinase subunit PxpB, partial [Firmicutes bacterium]|nr:5-oxoprolinase subunit PxpB [Bacillota bacterium]